MGGAGVCSECTGTCLVVHHLSPSRVLPAKFRLAEFTGLMGTRVYRPTSIPQAMQPKEFLLKLTENAAKWYATEYSHLRAFLQVTFRR